MNPIQKKPPSLDGDRMKIEYHGRHGVLHVTATFPISKLDEFAAHVSERKLQFEREGSTPRCSSDANPTDGEVSTTPVYTFPKSMLGPKPLASAETRSVFSESPKVVKIDLDKDK